MRHPATPRKMASHARGHILRRTAAAIMAAAALAGCEHLQGEPNETAVVTGAAADDLAWSFARTAELEAELAKLAAENARLSKKVAELEAAKTKQAAAQPPAPEQTAAAANGAAQRPSAPAAPVVKPETVVAAPEAGRALAGSAPVDSSPRLVQPSFASVEETVFENEANGGDIPLSSVMYGVHLASYRVEAEARNGWRKLQRENPDELGLLEPRVETVSLENRGEFLRLIGGGFTTQDKAAALCSRLKNKGVYCNVTSFDGRRLSLSEG